MIKFNSWLFDYSPYIRQEKRELLLMPQQYKVNSPKVIHEEIQGEVVIINLDTGAYFSIVESGAAIWKQVIRGIALPALTEKMSLKYLGGAEEIRSGIEGFVKELTGEGLIVPAEPKASPKKSKKSDSSSKRETSKATELPQFKAPVLEKFTDMEEMLLLDPIHDVDESGW